MERTKLFRYIFYGNIERVAAERVDSDDPDRKYEDVHFEIICSETTKDWLLDRLGSGWDGGVWDEMISEATPPTEQHWEKERRESIPQIARYLAKDVDEYLAEKNKRDMERHGETFPEYGTEIQSALSELDLERWKVPGSGWQGASNREFMTALAAEIRRQRTDRG